MRKLDVRIDGLAFALIEDGIGRRVEDIRLYLFTVRRRSVDCVPFLTLFRSSPAKRLKHRNVQSFVMWAFSPWMRYKLKKLKGFDGRETYTAQLKRTREIEVLEACLLHS